MRMFFHSVISVSSTGTMIVLKTAFRQRLRRRGSDRFPPLAGVLGSIAGDNTIFVAVRSMEDVPHGSTSSNR
jgi:arginine repressor